MALIIADSTIKFYEQQYIYLCIYTFSKKIQWFDEHSEVGSKVRGQRVLIVDEVDDTRETLRYCVEEVINTNHPSHVAVAVVHNKMKPKRGKLPEDVLYLAGANVADCWNCYPWDAAAYGHSIQEHERLAHLCSSNNVSTATDSIIKE